VKTEAIGESNDTKEKQRRRKHIKARIASRGKGTRRRAPDSERTAKRGRRSAKGHAAKEAQKVNGLRLVIIEWLDSFGCSSRWENLSNCDNPEPVICRSVGWLLSDTKACKVVVPHITPDQGCGDMTIPTIAIVSMRDLVAA
jgi:hypothetical protein